MFHSGKFRFLNYSLMSNRGMNGDVMSGRNRRGGSKSRLLSPPPSSAGNNNTAASVSNQVLSEGSIARVRGSSAERLLSPPPNTSPGVVNGHHGKTSLNSYFQSQLYPQFQ